MRSTDSTPNADPSPKASTSPPAKSLPERYICKPCNKTLPLSYKSTHEASKRHMMKAPITCTLCNVSYGKDCHEAHIIGKKHLANLDPGVAPGVSWDRPAKKKQLGNGVAPKRLGDGIDVIRLVPLKTAPAASPVLWRCGVCAASMAVGMRANHQNGKCVPAPLKTRGNPFRAQVNADKKAETKKKERKERIWGARERKGDRDRIWYSEDDYY